MHPSRRRLLLLSGRLWTPAQLPELKAWWDFSRIAGSDGDAITTVPDLSGNGNDATQGTAAKKFTLKTGANGINNLSVGRGDGIDDLMEANGLGPLMSGSDIPFTWWGVFRKVGNSSVDTVLGAGRVASATPLHALRTNAVQWNAIRRDDATALINLSTGVVNTSPFVLVHRFPGTVFSLWINGLPIWDNTAMNVGVTTLDTFSLGALNSGGVASGFLEGDIGECGVCLTSLAASDINALGRYFSRKWTLTVADI